MTLNLANYEERARHAVKAFWDSRKDAKRKQAHRGSDDRGERSSVTSGKNMDGFIPLIEAIVRMNGLEDADICRTGTNLTLPGFFRPTKQWDLLVIFRGVLVAAIDLKSQVGPSFGNNFNNRAEEAIGTAHDFWTAFREGALGQQAPPFLGWLILVEDCDKSRSPVKGISPHFPVFSGFKGRSYLERYDLFCQKLIQEQLYTTATVLASPFRLSEKGEFSSLSKLTSLETFVTALAGHVAVQASRLV